MCRMSPVTCQLSAVSCHQRKQPQTCTNNLLTPPLCTVGWFAKTPKPKKKRRRKKSLIQQKSKNIQRYANISNTLFNQNTPVHREAGFPRWHTQTHTTDGHRNLETKSAQCSDLVKMGHEGDTDSQCVHMVAAIQKNIFKKSFLTCQVSCVT